MDCENEPALPRQFLHGEFLPEFTNVAKDGVLGEALGGKILSKFTFGTKLVMAGGKGRGVNGSPSSRPSKNGGGSRSSKSSASENRRKSGGGGSVSRSETEKSKFLMRDASICCQL